MEVGVRCQCAAPCSFRFQVGYYFFIRTNFSYLSRILVIIWRTCLSSLDIGKISIDPNHLGLDRFHNRSPKGQENALKLLQCLAQNAVHIWICFRRRTSGKLPVFNYQMLFTDPMTLDRRWRVIVLRFCHLTRVIRVCPLLLPVTLLMLSGKLTRISQT